MRKSTVPALVTLGLVALLAGCASIPTAGVVQAGIKLDDTSGIELDILARGPQEGDSQQQILEGFLAAAASPQLDYRIAREFLTADLSKTWKPDSGTTVDLPAERNASATSEASIALRIRPMASVSDDGVYSAAPTTAAETRNYSFVQVEGQWRISGAPQGIVIDQTSFGIVFGAYPLQFLSPDGRSFVPDVRWFARRETTQTAIVRALVAGPSDWLAPGVVSAVPTNAKLDADSVPIVNGSASVSLAVDRVPTGSEIARLAAQLRSSLMGVSGINGVTLVVNGSLENPAPILPAPQSESLIDARPAVLTDAGFGYLSSVSGQVEIDSALSGSLLALAPDSVSLGLGGAFAVTRSSTGISRVTSSGIQTVWFGSGWLPPSVDSAGGIWVTSSNGPMLWQGADGTQASFPAAWGDATVESIAVSRDGARLALLLQSGTSTRIVVSAIARGADGTPTGLGAPLFVAEVDGTGDALSWADSSTVAVLGSNRSGGRELTYAQVGGQATTSSAPGSATHFATGNSTRETRILDAQGQLLQSSGAAWQVRASGVRVLASQIGLR